MWGGGDERKWGVGGTTLYSGGCWVMKDSAGFLSVVASSCFHRFAAGTPES